MHRNRLRLTTLVVAVLVLAAAGARAIVLRFPTADECIASGRTVDATFRHCEDADGYVEIREHAIFHVRDAAYAVVLLVGGVGGVVYVIARRRNRRQSSS